MDIGSSSSFYDHFALERPTWIGQRWSIITFEKIFKLAEIEKGSSVLEIGPGRGLFADICFRENVQYHAIEPNQRLADDLIKKGAKVTSAIVPPLPELEGKFDAVVMINMFEHMSGLNDAVSLLVSIKEILNCKGKVIICSPDYLNLKHNFFDVDFSHNYVITRTRLEQLLLSLGFECKKSAFFSGPLTGFFAFVTSGIVARLPFAILHTAFSKNRVINKLFKFQKTFSRKVLVIAETRGQT
jgi:SAM-dependent methyltransferase